MFCQRDERVVGGIESGDRSGFDIVDPAVECQSPLGQREGYRGMGADVVQLGDDILAHHAVNALFFCRVVAGLIDHAGGIGMAQPVLDCRHVIQTGAGSDCRHRAAVGMAANHDVRHLQLGHCILYRGADAAGLGAERWHDVAGVANDEQITGFALRDELRHHPAVGAGDEQRLRRLAGRQRLEQFFVGWVDFLLKAQKTIDDVVHIGVGRGF